MKQRILPGYLLDVTKYKKIEDAELQKFKGIDLIDSLKKEFYKEDV